MLHFRVGETDLTYKKLIYLGTKDAKTVSKYQNIITSFHVFVVLTHQPKTKDEIFLIIGLNYYTQTNTPLYKKKVLI